MIHNTIYFNKTPTLMDCLILIATRRQILLTSSAIKSAVVKTGSRAAMTSSTSRLFTDMAQIGTTASSTATDRD